MIIQFTSTWKTATGRSFVFETAEPLDTAEITQGNQELCSSFRLDIPDDIDSQYSVYIIGDSNEGGYLVCEEAGELFYGGDLFWDAYRYLAHAEVNDVQADYDEWLKEYEDGQD